MLILGIRCVAVAELAPRRSRSMALTALNHFKDLQHAINPSTSPSESEHLFALGLPIFICDAVISAYACKPALISQVDLDTYFTSTELFRPDFSKDKLDEILTRWLTSSPESEEGKEGGEENGIDAEGDGRMTTEDMGLNQNSSAAASASATATATGSTSNDQPMQDSTRPNASSGQLLGLDGNPISRTTVDGIIDLEEEEKAEETVTHASLSKCTTILCCWLGEVRRFTSFVPTLTHSYSLQVQREFARISSRQWETFQPSSRRLIDLTTAAAVKSASSIPLSVELYGLWSAIDQVHSAVQRIRTSPLLLL